MKRQSVVRIALAPHALEDWARAKDVHKHRICYFSGDLASAVAEKSFDGAQARAVAATARRLAREGLVTLFQRRRDDADGAWDYLAERLDLTPDRTATFRNRVAGFVIPEKDFGSHKADWVGRIDHGK